MKRFFILMILAAVTAMACTDRDDNINAVNIRIQNSTGSVLQEVRIADMDTLFENIAVDGFSEYLEFDIAFREMPVTAVADSMNFSFTPESMVMDSLPVGFYTYQLSLDEAQQLDVTFKVD